MLRIWNHAVLKGIDAVKEVVWQALRQLCPPSLILPPKGGGEMHEGRFLVLQFLALQDERRRSSCTLMGAALGRVAMRAKLVTSGKADVSSPTRCSQNSPCEQA